MNFWVLNFLIVCSLLLLNVNIKNIHYKLLSLIILVLMNQTQTYINIFFKKLLIQSLWVGTINIHPMLFYLSLVLINQYLYFQNINSFFQKSLLTNSRLTVYNIFALTLGGLWGSQSLAWGYFWVNDNIEWLLLSFCIILVHQKHKLCINYTCYFLLINLLLLYTILFFIRFNILATRHSFFTSFNLSLWLLYLYWFIVLFLSFLNFFKKKIKTKAKVTFWYVLFYIMSSNIYYIIILFKYKLIRYSNYFFYYTNFFLFSFLTSLIHFFLILFLFIWSLPFPPFFLKIQNSEKVINYSKFYLKTLVTVSDVIVNIKFSKSLLEFITFSVNFSVNLYINYSGVFLFESVFNLFSFLLLLHLPVLFFFFKGFEFRFLYKKKAYF